MIDKNVFMYRAYLALKKFGVVRDEVGGNSHELLQPLKALMAYVQSEGSSIRSVIVEEIEVNPFTEEHTRSLIQAKVDLILKVGYLSRYMFLFIFQ